MAATTVSKKKAKSQKAPPKKKQKNEFFTAKDAKVNEISDHSETEDEEIYGNPEVVRTIH